MNRGELVGSTPQFSTDPELASTVSAGLHQGGDVHEVGRAAAGQQYGISCSVAQLSEALVAGRQCRLKDLDTPGLAEDEELDAGIEEDLALPLQAKGGGGTISDRGCKHRQPSESATARRCCKLSLEPPCLLPCCCIPGAAHAPWPKPHRVPCTEVLALELAVVEARILVASELADCVLRAHTVLKLAAKLDRGVPSDRGPLKACAEAGKRGSALLHAWRFEQNHVPPSCGRSFRPTVYGRKPRDSAARRLGPSLLPPPPPCPGGSAAAAARCDAPVLPSCGRSFLPEGHSHGTRRHGVSVHGLLPPPSQGCCLRRRRHGVWVHGLLPLPPPQGCCLRRRR